MYINNKYLQFALMSYGLIDRSFNTLRELIRVEHHDRRFIVILGNIWHLFSVPIERKNKCY